MWFPRKEKERKLFFFSFAFPTQHGIVVALENYEIKCDKTGEWKQEKKKSRKLHRFLWGARWGGEGKGADSRPEFRPRRSRQRHAMNFFFFIFFSSNTEI